jgi:O-antigen/teichoic acid export membrane protein
MLSDKSIKKLFLNTIVYGISGSFVALIPLVLLPFMARFLTQNEYGYAIFFSALITMLLPVVGFGSANAISVRYFQLEHKLFGSYLWSCIFVLLLSILLILLLFILFRPLVINLINIQFKWVLIAVCVAGFWGFSQACSTLLIAKGRPLKYLCINASIGIVTIILSLCFIGYLGYNWAGYAWALFCAHLFASLLSLKYLRLERHLTKISKENCIDCLKFGLPIMIHSIAMSLISYFDRLIISNYLDLEHLARYGVAFQLGIVISFVAQAFNKAFVPWLYKNLKLNTETAKVKIVRGTYTIFFGIVLLTIFYSFTLEYIIEYVAGEQYADAYFISVIIAIGGAFNAAYLMVVNYIFYANKTIYLGIVSISVAILFIGLSIIMVPRYGLAGASVSFLFANILLFSLVWYLAAKSFSMPWFSRKILIGNS